MSSNGGSVLPNALLEQVNDDGVPITYACEYQLGMDPTTATATSIVVNVEQFYDLVYPCAENKHDAASDISNLLLNEAANLWNILPGGYACTVPQNEYSAWLFGVSSGDPDDFVSDFGCQNLTPDNLECCQVVRSEMQFIPTGGYDILALQQFVQDQLNSDATTDAFPYRTAAIEPLFGDALPNDAPRDNLNDPNSGASGVQAQEPQEAPTNQKITLTGGFVITLLVAAVLGFFLIIYRRNRKQFSGDTLGHAKDDAFCDTTMEQGPSCENDDHRMAIVSDNDTNNSCPREDPPFCEVDLDPELHQRNMDNDDLEEQPPAKYAFDLSESFKNDVMGTYGGFGFGGRQQPAPPTTMQVVAPYPMMEDTSCDSEADSWAQTDGTVGSLEERLEEITAEI